VRYKEFNIKKERFDIIQGLKCGSFKIEWIMAIRSR